MNSITNMAYMLDHVIDSEFKAILEKHFPYHVRDYNMKVEFINNQQGTQKERISQFAKQYQNSVEGSSQSMYQN